MNIRTSLLRSPHSGRRRLQTWVIALLTLIATVVSAGYTGHYWYRVGPAHHASDDPAAAFVGPWYGHTHDPACPGPLLIVASDYCYAYYHGPVYNLPPYHVYPYLPVRPYPYGDVNVSVVNITNLNVMGGTPNIYVTQDADVFVGGG